MIHLALRQCFEEDGDGFFGAADLRVGIAPGEVPGAQPLQIGELGRAQEQRAGTLGIPQQIEVMTDQPHGARGDRAEQHVGADLIVIGACMSLADVVEECGGEEIGIGGLGQGVLEHLQGVEERAPLRVVHGVLLDAIEVVEPGQHGAVHGGTGREASAIVPDAAVASGPVCPRQNTPMPVAQGMFSRDPRREHGMVALPEVAMLLWIQVVFAGFTDVSVQAGVAVQHDPAYNDSFPAGGAVGDFDNDGWIDLYIASGGNVPDRLLINQGDGTFVDEAAAWGIDDTHQGTGATVGDFDGDGWLDLYVTSLGPTPGVYEAGQHRLLHNLGGTGFTDVAAVMGVDSIGAADGWGGAWGDYDLDGDLDLAVAGWRTQTNRLFRNDGVAGFTDVTVSAGLTDHDSIWGFAPRFADMDGDGWPELIMIGDFGTTEYYQNLGGGQFLNITDTTGAALDTSEMGVTLADLDEDGLFDWYVTTVRTNNLYMNQGGHVYLNEASAAGVQDGGWGWGAVSFDLDHDTDIDLFSTSQSNRQYVYINEATTPGEVMFTERGLLEGVLSTVSGRAMANLDYDNDGDQDFLIIPHNGQVTLYRNDLDGPDTHWLRVFLDRGDQSGIAPNGVGSRLIATLDGRELHRQIDAGSNYLCNSELSAHWGLGAATVLDRLRVEWTNGRVTELEQVPVDQTLTLRPPALGPAGDGELDVLRVNGSDGGVEGRVVHTGGRLEVSMNLGGAVVRRQAVFARQGVPTVEEAWDMAGVQGSLAFTPCRFAPMPGSIALVDDFGGASPCPALFPAASPLSLRVGSPPPGTYTVQAVVQVVDAGGPRVVTTNGIVVEVP